MLRATYKTDGERYLSFSHLEKHVSRINCKTDGR
jgi:hypothetical protein